jgi:RNA:NAD 2'-phosphotransferase (TPT1/KptA family)
MRELINIITESSGHKTLWHGTSENPELIEKHGLKSGRYNAVFLTDNPELALEYAESDQDRTGNDFAVVVTVDVTKLNHDLLSADLDHTTVDSWEESLAETDQCMYQGNIPPSAIISVEEY